VEGACRGTYWCTEGDIEQLETVEGTEYQGEEAGAGMEMGVVVVLGQVEGQRRVGQVEGADRRPEQAVPARISTKTRATVEGR